MTVRAVKVKGEQLSFLAHADSAEQLLTGTATGETPTGWSFKVKGTYVYWVDNDGNERRKQGTLTGAGRTKGNITVHGEDLYFGDDDGNERYVRQAVTATYYPDAHPESSSVDGHVHHQDNISDWATLRDGAGTYSDDDDDKDYVAHFECAFTTNKYDVVGRGIFLFDTSEIPDDATIISAVLHLYTTSRFNYRDTWLDAKVNIYTSNPASNTALVGGDFDSLGTTPLCDTDTPYTDLGTLANPKWNTFTLNAAGLAAISKTGITKLGTREVTYDVGNIAPAWVSGGEFRWTVELAETALGAEYRPKLVIVYE